LGLANSPRLPGVSEDLISLIYDSLIKGFAVAVISMRYPKVHGAESRKYDRLYVVPLEVDNEKYPVDLDGRPPNLGKRHSHREKSKVGIRFSSCA